jgi:iron complex outermembrane receptor protein
MNKYIQFLLSFLLFSVFILGNKLSAQTFYQLKGRVVDENNRPVSGATVILPSTNKGTVTTKDGSFILSKLTKKRNTIKISFVGYQTLTREITVSDKEIYTFKIKESTVKLAEVVLDDNYLEEKQKENSLNVEVVNEEYLKQNLGGSLMKSLERLPGVSTIDIGSGQSKPVIRGLGFNRVVVVENNIKHESQQWGADHGLEIDQYAVENVEIIKGPASLMYGSDAIGGVIDMKNRSLPEENTFGGSVDLTGKTNNDFLGTSISLFGRKKDFFAKVRATIVDYGDYKVPTDSVDVYNYKVPLYKNHLRNTAGKELNFHGTFGVVKDKFHSKFYLSNVYSKNGFFANAHGLEPRNVNHQIHDSSNRDILYPYSQVNHFKAINKTTFWSDKWNIELDLGYQRNFREERSQYVQHGYMPAVFPDTLSFNPEIERQFTKNILSANAKLFYELSDKTQLNAGLNSEYKHNAIGGRGFIIPSFKQVNVGGFLVGKHTLSEKSMVQAGIRLDYGNIKTEQHFDWFKSPIVVNQDTVYKHLERAQNINRNFFNFSWSLGYNYHPKNWIYKVNIGKSFRMPIAKELAANGVNYHRFSYEVGNPNLSPEVSYQFDGGVEYSSKDFAIGASPFINYFSNYIYLNPTSKFDRLYGFGNQVFEYTEAQVLRYGTEIHAHYEFSKHWQFGFIGEYVYSEQLTGSKKGYTLPFAPPASVIFNIKYQKNKLGPFHNFYTSVDWRLTAAQSNIVPPEVTTPGYHSFNLGIGGEFKLKKQRINLSVQVQNLFNQKFFNHTSYYRLINIPEPGRNLIVHVSIPFLGRM